MPFRYFPSGRNYFSSTDFPFDLPLIPLPLSGRHFGNEIPVRFCPVSSVSGRFSAISDLVARTVITENLSAVVTISSSRPRAMNTGAAKTCAPADFWASDLPSVDPSSAATASRHPRYLDARFPNVAGDHDLAIARLELTCAPDNLASQRLAERCGFTPNSPGGKRSPIDRLWGDDRVDREPDQNSSGYVRPAGPERRDNQRRGDQSGPGTDGVGVPGEHPMTQILRAIHDRSWAPFARGHKRTKGS